MTPLSHRDTPSAPAPVEPPPPPAQALADCGCHERLQWLVPASAVLVATLLFRELPLDQTITGWFYRPGEEPRFALDGNAWERVMYHLGVWPGLLVGLIGLLGGLGALFYRPWRPAHRVLWFFATCVILVPGVLINDVLKEDFGRPRPRDVQDFGGERVFLPVWQHSEQPGHAFPSGHAAIAFAIMFPYFWLRYTPRRRLARAFLWGGLAWGTLMGLARVGAGGHWASDVLWAGALTWFGGLFFARVFLLHEASPTTTVPVSSANGRRS